MISEIGMPAIKLSSGLMTNLPLIMGAAETGLPLIISTGMAYLDEVVEAVGAARGAGATKIVILQCTKMFKMQQVPARNHKQMQEISNQSKTNCFISFY